MQCIVNMNSSLRLINLEMNSIITILSTFVIKEDLYFSSSSSDSSLESSFSSDEEIDISTLYAIIMVGQTRGVNVPREKLTDYVERVVPGYSR